MKNLIYLTQFLFFLGLYGQNNVAYTENLNVIANPERGLQKYSITDANYSSTNNYTNINRDTLEAWRESSDKVTVVFRYFLLSNFLNSDINQTYLDNIQNDFDVIRSAGLKVIVRFSYSDNISNGPQQPLLSQILKHLGQLSPILNLNKDVILSHQAGFIGTWGEWYYTNSNEFGTEGAINQEQWDNRKAVVDSMLGATPENVPIQVRYAEIKKTLYGSAPLTNQTAYKNTNKARVGFYNDAFLNNWGDQGTYSVNSMNESPVGSEDYIYISNETKYVPMTGETNGLNSSRTDAANAIFELDSVNWTTLNRDYYTENWNNWILAGKYNEILRNLGYRFVLNESDFLLNGTDLSISILLENKGYARLFKAREVYLVLENTISGDTSQFLLNTDPRTWMGAVNINQVIDLRELDTESYEAYLFIPDNSPNLRNQAAYSIKFANEGVWDSANGRNKLNQTVSISRLVSNNDLERKQAFIVHPNPSSGHINISINTDISCLVIYNEYGVIVKEIDNIVQGDVLEISLNEIGVYFIKASVLEGVFNQKVLVIE